jgi:hypothetical protein
VEGEVAVVLIADDGITWIGGEPWGWDMDDIDFYVVLKG